jgi:hypothetical protein
MDDLFEVIDVTVSNSMSNKWFDNLQILPYKNEFIPNNYELLVNFDYQIYELFTVV